MDGDFHHLVYVDRLSREAQTAFQQHHSSVGGGGDQQHHHRHQHPTNIFTEPLHHVLTGKSPTPGGGVSASSPSAGDLDCLGTSMSMSENAMAAYTSTISESSNGHYSHRAHHHQHTPVTTSSSTLSTSSSQRKSGHRTTSLDSVKTPVVAVSGEFLRI